MIGREPIRRTVKYLEAGKLVLKNSIQIMQINYNTHGPHHQGLRLEKREYKCCYLSCLLCIFLILMIWIDFLGALLLEYLNVTCIILIFLLNKNHALQGLCFLAFTASTIQESRGSSFDDQEQDTITFYMVLLWYVILVYSMIIIICL